MKVKLTRDTANRPFPLNLHERTEHVLSDKSRLQENLEKIESFTIENEMKINVAKTKVMMFNRSKHYDFPPEFHFSDGNLLECLDECKLLGVKLCSNLKWDSNTNAIYKKAMGRMWLLRRMKTVKLENRIILDYYIKEVRPLAEHGVPAWNSGLTQSQVKQLEKIKKVAFYIIFGKFDIDYPDFCESIGLKTLEQRRHQLCTSFAIKLFKSQRRDEYFNIVSSNYNTRNSNTIVKEDFTKTISAYNAPHNYLSRLINQNAKKLKQFLPM